MKKLSFYEKYLIITETGMIILVVFVEVVSRTFQTEYRISSFVIQYSVFDIEEMLWV